LEFLRLVQPDLDTKPGTVSRDLFVDAQAEQLANFYNELRTVSSLQSFFSANGNDLARLGSNFGVSRITGANATGVAVFTTNDLDVDILIPSNTVVTARNGITFKTLTSAIMRATSSNVYKATATRLQTDLNLAGITDEFAIEVNVEATTPGTGGNIGRFSIISQNVPGISNITNLESFSGGTNPESDSEFRTRILSVFAGSNTGTALGYETAIKTLPNVEDVVTIVPGDPLLIRDGTQVVEDDDGNLVVSEAGTGGKIDIYILGSDLESNIDSFIYNDQSGLDDPTSSLNDYILGARGTDTTLTASQRRVELIEADTLPFQPVDSIISVTGSSSGGNFIEKYTDDNGETRGNYELLKDTGDFGGSPFGFDKLHFISDRIELDDEETTKGIFNGSDALLFSDVTGIRSITQDVFVTNENSTTSTTNRSSVQLNHSPVRTVSRVVNLTTGERYVVSNQNPDGDTGDLNTTGRITISGNTLPVGTDILQVDYTWVKPYDNFFDFDNLEIVNNFRTVQDSVDWAFGNLITYEPTTIEDDGYGTLTVELTHPVSKVSEISRFQIENAVVSSGAVTLSEVVVNVVDMRRVSDGVEVFNTDLSNGTLSGTTAVILPTDTLAEDGDTITVRYNTVDLFSIDENQGTFEENIVTLSEDASSVYDGYLDAIATYAADVQTLIPTTELTALPITRNVNKFNISGAVDGEQPTSNLYSGSVIYKNLRRAASHIRVDAASIGSSGSISIIGTSRHEVSDVLVTVVSENGYDIDLSTAILSDSGLSSIPSTLRVSQLKSVERVNVSNAGLVTSVDNVYDIVNYRINDNSLDIEVGISDSTLNTTSISLPRTDDNIDAILETGDIVRVTFYYLVEDDTEQLFFSRNGRQTTDKVFLDIERISLSSGFLNAAGDVTGEISVSNFNQPLDNTSYEVDYDYVSPKENERITVTYNTNDTIRDATLLVEDVRPITADVLIKEAEAVDIDISVRIVVLPEFEDSEDTVVQDSIDSITSFLNANSLGTIVDASDVVNNLYTVSGIDRVRILNFSTGGSGNLLSIEADKNQYLRAGTVDVQVEER
jgi:phage-related baseplate assembly protein